MQGYGSSKKAERTSIEEAKRTFMEEAKKPSIEDARKPSIEEVKTPFIEEAKRNSIEETSRTSSADTVTELVRVEAPMVAGPSSRSQPSKGRSPSLFKVFFSCSEYFFYYIYFYFNIKLFRIF
jgi:hypothetical protein